MSRLTESSLPRPPFNNPAADTIIRSSDGVDFRVRSGIVAEASPIFSDMFALPLPDCTGVVDSPDFMDGKPVVAVQENSIALDRLLRLCYPTADPVLPEVKDVRTVFAAALKYEMEEAIALMKSALLGFVDRQPLAVWATACEFRLEDEAKIAARALVGTDIPADAPPELQNVTAGAYYRLVKFHRAGGAMGDSFKFCEPDPEVVPKPKPSLLPAKSSTMTYQARPFADIICRSADGQEYQTHKIILSAASPLLRDQIDALATNPSSGSLPVLQLDVPGHPLGILLEICYPVQCDLPSLSVRDALAAMSCARRLDMKAPFTLLRFTAMAFTKVSEPLATYLLASNLGLAELVEDALPFMQPDPYTYGCIPEMEVTPALPYHRLLVNRRTSLAVVASEMTSTLRIGRSQSATKRTSDVHPLGDDGAAARGPSSNTGSASSATGAVDLPLGGDPWLRGILERTVEELRSPRQEVNWWNKPDTLETLKESLSRKLWCGPCEENLRIVLQIEKLHTDVHNAMNATNAKLRPPRS
ncbi:hypothetical protein C8T65DRAFT_742183 [Cerioporus squamosus]|nr:hypothetical protein C8T65DRAFT_742183 [Cerioporus squamosus]